MSESDDLRQEEILLLDYKPRTSSSTGSPTLNSKSRSNLAESLSSGPKTNGTNVQNKDGNNATRGRLDWRRKLENHPSILEQPNYSAGECSLHLAARTNQPEVIAEVLSSGVNVNGLGDHDQTALHLAVRYNNVEAVDALLEHGADPSVRNAEGATPLHLAARRGNLVMAQKLLSDSRSHVDCADNSGVTPFHLVCASGNLRLCRLFFEHKANFEAVTNEGKSPLHFTASSGHAQIAEVLIEKASSQMWDSRFYLDQCDSESSTALGVAAMRGHASVVKLCLARGANINGASDDAPHTALHLAATHGHVAVVELLIGHGADVDVRDELQRTPLHKAAAFNHLDVIKLLLKNGADVNAMDCTHSTPFLAAVKHGQNVAADLLLEHGADLCSRDRCFRSCVHLAVLFKQYDTLRMLLGRDTCQLADEGDKELRSPLHYAADSGSVRALSILLGANCRADREDADERTALHLAAQNGHRACVEALLNTAPALVNNRDERGLTALHLAAGNGRRKVCVTLLRCGSDASCRDINRRTALHHAAGAGCLATVEQLLLSCPLSMVKAKDNDGNTALHLACQQGEANAVALLLSHDCDVTALNKDGRTCLDVAVQFGREEVAVVITGSLKPESLFAMMQVKDSHDIIPLRNLIEKMPEVAKRVLDHSVTYSDHPTDHPDYSVTFDFRLLEHRLPTEEGRRKAERYFAPTTMVEHNREDLLGHPLCQALLFWKWSSLGQVIYFVDFALFLIYLVTFTQFLVSERSRQLFFNPNDDGEKSREQDDRIFRTRTTLSKQGPYFITIFVVAHMLKELYQIAVLRRSYLHLTNLFEWSCYTLSLFVMVPYLVGRNVYEGSGSFWPIASLAILLAYVCCILFLRRISFFGLYITMFTEVLKTLLRVLSVFSLFIVAFALAFFILLKEQAPFSTLEFAFVKTFMMMLGELDYDSIIIDSQGANNGETDAPLLPSPALSITILCVFALLMTVLLMNLLVGLAVGDIDTIQKNATMERLAMQVDIVNAFDERYPMRWARWLKRTSLVVKPNQKTSFNMMLKVGHPTHFSQMMALRRERELEQKDTSDSLDAVRSELLHQKHRVKKLGSLLKEQHAMLAEIGQQVKAIQAQIVNDTK